jgi:large subunit ribosomal protein L30
MKLKITQVRSIIGALQNQKATIKALGLGRPNYVSIKPKNAQTLGMVNTVRHLVTVEEIAD